MTALMHAPRATQTRFATAGMEIARIAGQRVSVRGACFRRRGARNR